jgi:serine protease AprX
MTPALGIAWNDSKRSNRSKTLAGLLLLPILLLTLGPIAGVAQRMVSLIVRAEPGKTAPVGAEVRELGGTVTRTIGIIDAVVVRAPESALGELQRAPYVRSITPNAAVHLLHTVDGFDASTDAGSLYNVTKTVKAQDVWRNGYTGAGVDVALVDSGVSPVAGLTFSGKVINGPDLSFESQSDDLRYLDTYGHGTHLAGIIAGRDNNVASLTDMTAHDNFDGVAPGARIVSIKVANALGATDVSQVLAAIDWVVQHRTDNGMNIRVLNLSFGTDSAQDYVLDPLAYAAEVAWRKGIVVVVAAGNSGSSLGRLNDPAVDPYVISVAADDSKGSTSTSDDTIPDWSSRGDGTRNPDVVAPGRSIVSLRDPNSYIDAQFGSTGKVNNRFFRGSGTSQATAVVSGAAALLLQQRPNLTPDQVKKLLMSTTAAIPGADATAQGTGLINVARAAAATTPHYQQTWPTSSGTGSLEDARGSAHIVDSSGSVLTGEMDIFGNVWDGTSWSDASWSGTSWSGGTWNGTSWSGTSWCGTSWSGTSWSGTSWSGTSWSGTSWSGTSWSGTSWSGTSWSGTSWSGGDWAGSNWVDTPVIKVSTTTSA